MCSNHNQIGIFKMVDHPPTYTIVDAMIACGVDNISLFNETQASRLANNLFSNDFSTCMDKSFEELDSDFKTFSELTANQGQIRLLPGVKLKIKSFVQWVRDEKRLGRDPKYTVYPVADVAVHMRRYKTHQEFLKG